MGKKKQSTAEYKSAMANYNRLNKQYEELINKYTGNEGYDNSIQQAVKGAGVMAQNQAAQTQSAARNAGMNKAQAAAMGASGINANYANNFNTQQTNALNSGVNALNTTQQAGSNYLNYANTEANEENARWDRKNAQWNVFSNSLGSIGQGVGSGLTGAAAMFSDERCKVAKETPKDISKCLSDIDAYIFKYKNKAQEEAPEYCDDNLHIGVMAQELEENPVLKDVIHETEDGIKTVDTASLTMSNTALLADIAKRLERLEELFPIGKGE